MLVHFYQLSSGQVLGYEGDGYIKLEPTRLKLPSGYRYINSFNMSKQRFEYIPEDSMIDTDAQITLKRSFYE